LDCRLTPSWICVDTPKLRFFGGIFLDISFSGPTASRRPVGRPSTGPETLTGHTRLEAICAVSQAVAACHKHAASVEGSKPRFSDVYYPLKSTEPCRKIVYANWIHPSI
jgi:hypothetical protein